MYSKESTPAVSPEKTAPIGLRRRVAGFLARIVGKGNVQTNEGSVPAGLLQDIDRKPARSVLGSPRLQNNQWSREAAQLRGDETPPPYVREQTTVSQNDTLAASRRVWGIKPTVGPLLGIKDAQWRQPTPTEDYAQLNWHVPTLPALVRAANSPVYPVLGRQGPGHYEPQPSVSPSAQLLGRLAR